MTTHATHRSIARSEPAVTYWSNRLRRLEEGAMSLGFDRDLASLDEGR